MSTRPENALPPALHRHGGDLFTPTDWPDAPPVARRVSLALGRDPIASARHLLAPIVLPDKVAGITADGPQPATQLVIDLPPSIESIRHISNLTAQKFFTYVFPPAKRAGLGFVRFWATTSTGGIWQAVETLAPDTVLGGTIALCWELTALPASDEAALAHEIDELLGIVGERTAFMSRFPAPRTSLAETVDRAGRLIALQTRFARSVEMRLLPTGRRFGARDVWRAAYALGLEWGDFDLFHWRNATPPRSLFTLAATGQPGYFLPERAAEGETIPGLILSFELPSNPAPLETFDRMAVALAYLRQTLGGRPTAPDGAEYDSERLDTDRDSLARAVAEMTHLGLAPGSDAAVRFF